MFSYNVGRRVFYEIKLLLVFKMLTDPRRPISVKGQQRICSMPFFSLEYFRQTFQDIRSDFESDYV